MLLPHWTSILKQAGLYVTWAFLYLALILPTYRCLPPFHLSNPQLWEREIDVVFMFAYFCLFIYFEGANSSRGRGRERREKETPIPVLYC